MRNRPDIAVIGAGCIGLATAEALAERGESVALYESGRPGQGQSAGQGRVFRHAADDPRVVSLAAESRELWRGLEERLGEEMISRDGVLALGEAALGRLSTLEERGIHARRIGPDEISERHPLLAGFGGDGVFDEAGGAIRTLSFIRLLSQRLADSFEFDEVIAVRPTGAETVEVRVPGHRAEYSRVIVCAGRGTAQLARGAGLDVPVDLACHIRSTFEVAGEAPDRVACLLDSAGEWGDESVYAAPAPGCDRYSIGLAEVMEVREDGSVVDPAQFAAHEERMIEYAKRALPGLNPQPVEVLHCWATSLPWNEDAFAIWEHEGLLIVGGHNIWKMAPVIGAALAEAAAGGEVREEMRPEARLGEA